MEKICKELRIQRKNVLSFGDSMNDSELLELSGIGVAMSGSPEELQKRADLSKDNISRVLDLLIETC